MIIRYRPPGYEAEVATLDSPDAPFLGEFPFQVHALGNRRKSWYSPRLVPWLRSNRDRFDGIIVHGLWEFTGLAALLAMAGHKPFLVFTHGMLDPYFKRRYPLKHLKKWVYWLLAQYWVLRGCLACHVHHRARARSRHQDLLAVALEPDGGLLRRRSATAGHR